jgi:hypothetical protein
LCRVNGQSPFGHDPFLDGIDPSEIERHLRFLHPFRQDQSLTVLIGVREPMYVGKRIAFRTRMTVIGLDILDEKSEPVLDAVEGTATLGLGRCPHLRRVTAPASKDGEFVGGAKPSVACFNEHGHDIVKGRTEGM